MTPKPHELRIVYRRKAGYPRAMLGNLKRGFRDGWEWAVFSSAIIEYARPTTCRRLCRGVL